MCRVRVRRLRRGYEFPKYVSALDLIQRAVTRHAEMIDAIARKDADATEKLAHEHTMLFQKRFLDYMRQNMTESMALP